MKAMIVDGSVTKFIRTKNPCRNPAQSSPTTLRLRSPIKHTFQNQKTHTKTVMKTYIPYSLILAVAASGMAFGAETAYTTPVGYVTLGDTTAGQPSLKARTDALLTVPVDKATAYAGLVASVAGGNQIILQGTPAFTGTQWTATPFVAKIQSGTKSGFYALITLNSGNSVTVSLPTGQNLVGIVSGDKIAIKPAWTAKSLFASSALPADTELYQYNGVAPGINVASSSLFVWDGTDWIDGVTGNPSDPIVYPGELFVLRNVGNSAIPSIVVSGEVPVAGFTNLITNFGAGQQDLPFGVASPVDQTLSQAGLVAVASADDELNIYNNGATGINKAASTVFVFDGAGWLDAVTGNPVPSTYTLKAGVGFVYRRAAAKPTITWTATPSYIPSL